MPVPGVKVTIGIRRTKLFFGLPADTFEYPVLTTNQEGRFSVENARGVRRQLDLEVALPRNVSYSTRTVAS